MAGFVLFFGAWRRAGVGVERIGVHHDDPILDELVRDPYRDEEWAGEELERRVAVIRRFLEARTRSVTAATVESLEGPPPTPWMNPEIEKRLAADPQLTNGRRLLEFFERAVAERANVRFLGD